MSIDSSKKTDPTLSPSTQSDGRQVNANNDALSQLALLLGNLAGINKLEGTTFPASWQRRQALICISDSTVLQKAQNSLSSTHFETTICDTATKTVEILRDSRIDIVILDPQFNAVDQGGIVVLRYINAMMPKYRRRMYLVLVSSQVKTLDTYMAFLNGVNLTVNIEDIDTLSDILIRSIKDFNDLYRPYNAAAGLSPF